MDDELKDLFFDAIDHFPLEQRDAAQRWLKKRVVLAKVAEQPWPTRGRSCRQSLSNRVARN